MVVTIDWQPKDVRNFADTLHNVTGVLHCFCITPPDK